MLDRSSIKLMICSFYEPYQQMYSGYIHGDIAKASSKWFSILSHEGSMSWLIETLAHWRSPELRTTIRTVEVDKIRVRADTLTEGH